MSIFGQVWLWSIAAFVLGVLLTWLLLVRPAQSRARALERRLAESQAGSQVAGAEQAPAFEAPQASAYPAASDDPVSSPGTTRFEPLEAETTTYVRPDAGRHDEYQQEPEQFGAEQPGWEPVPEHRPLADIEAEQQAPGGIGAALAPEEEPAWSAPSPFDTTTVPEREPEQREPDSHIPDDYASDDYASDDFPSDHYAPGDYGPDTYGPDTYGPDTYGPDTYEPQPEPARGLFQPAVPAPGDEPVEPEPGPAPSPRDELTEYHPVLERPQAQQQAPPESEVEQTQVLPKRQPRQAPQGGFEPPQPIQPSMRTVHRREPGPEVDSTHSGSLFEPAVPSGTSGNGAGEQADSPELPPARDEPPAGDAAGPAGPFGPGSAMPLPGGGKPSDGFDVKASVTTLRYCTAGSAKFDQMVAEVWFRTAADAERVGFRPLD